MCARACVRVHFRACVFISIAVGRIAFGYGSVACSAGVELVLTTLSRYMGCDSGIAQPLIKVDLANGGFMLVRCMHSTQLQTCKKWLGHMLTDIAREHYFTAIGLHIFLYFCDFHDLQGESTAVMLDQFLYTVHCTFVCVTVLTCVRFECITHADYYTR